MLSVEEADFWPDVDIQYDYLWEEGNISEIDDPLDIDELIFNDIDEY